MYDFFEQQNEDAMDVCTYLLGMACGGPRLPLPFNHRYSYYIVYVQYNYIYRMRAYSIVCMCVSMYDICSMKRTINARYKYSLSNGKCKIMRN